MANPAGRVSAYQSRGGRKAVEYSTLAEQIGSNIQKIAQNVSSLKKLVNVNQSQKPQDSDQLLAKLRNIQLYTNVLAKDTKERLKEFNLLSLAGNPAEQHRLQIQKTLLTTEFTKIMNTFDSPQREAIANIRQAHSNKASNLLFGDSRSQNLIEIECPVENEGQLTLNREDEERQLEDLRRQDEAISKLETDILKVTEIFQDLATMVHEEGETVDNLSVQIELAHNQVIDGSDQLNRARDQKMKLRKIKTICLICFGATILLVVILSIWLSD